MRNCLYVSLVKEALSNAAMTTRAIAAGLDLLRMNRSDDPGLSDDHHEAFCWLLEQSAIEVGGAIDMAMYILRTEPQEEASHGSVAANVLQAG
ncbi:hypothetical protein ABZN20_18640 [Methylococcus sp. ANG]|uniref:hypothetical protein n=1 Tax=Methylococcus sp. ANG TaxID=3231903 RepID=UPI00345957F9